jgi:hypothetical protein
MSNSDSPHIFRSFLGKNRIFTTFRFNTQYVFPESGKRFFADSHDDPSFLDKNHTFATFRFNTPYAFPESGKRFFASKKSNSDSPACFYLLEWPFPKNFFENFFTWVAPFPYCAVVPEIFLYLKFSCQYTHFFCEFCFS